MTIPQTPERRFLAAFLFFLGLGAVVNVAWDLGLSDSLASVRVADNDDMISLANAETSGLPIKVGFALSLRSVASDGILVVPTEDAVERRQVELLANMALVVESYESQLGSDGIDSLPSADRIEGDGTLRFGGDKPVSYIILWDRSRGPAEVMRLFTTATDSVVVIDERLVEEMAE